jgi:broad specificity phosphatase PhoE
LQVAGCGLEVEVYTQYISKNIPIYYTTELYNITIKMIVFIRHANDDTKTRFKHDPHITPKGYSDAESQAKKLIKSRGIPDSIYYSPFRRCFETAHALSRNLDPKPKLIADSRVARYFNRQDRKNPSVSPCTIKYDVPIYETKEEFAARIKDFVRHINKEIKRDHKTVIWCVCHAYIYKKIAKELDIKVKSHIEFGDYFVCK